MIVERQSVELGELRLDSGETIPNVTVAFESYGQLNEARSNAVLIEHAFSGDAHAAGVSMKDGATGWWESMIGPGKAFDTDKYFVLCSNVLGGCSGTTGPGSTNPATGEPYGMSFPFVTIADMVRLQKGLLDHLGIEKLLSVSGGSMGGMQALEWGVMYPDRVASIVPIGGTEVVTRRVPAASPSQERLREMPWAGVRERAGEVMPHR